MFVLQFMYEHLSGGSRASSFPRHASTTCVALATQATPPSASAAVGASAQSRLCSAEVAARVGGWLARPTSATWLLAASAASVVAEEASPMLSADAAASATALRATSLVSSAFTLQLIQRIGNKLAIPWLNSTVWLSHASDVVTPQSHTAERPIFAQKKGCFVLK